jgi:CBS-domain-containing membrane protein
VGVLSRGDILRYDREHIAHAAPQPEFYAEADLNARLGDRTDEGFQVEAVDRTEVREIMSPVVYSVTPESDALETVQRMLDHNVHRLFVVDDTGTLVGVVSTIDVLRRLGRE